MEAAHRLGFRNLVIGVRYGSFDNYRRTELHVSDADAQSLRNRLLTNLSAVTTDSCWRRKRLPHLPYQPSPYPDEILGSWLARIVSSQVIGGER
jgi:hypothetical protein